MLHYKKIGSGAHIIILHGLFGSGDNWRTFAHSLKESFQVFLPDLRNHGRSSWTTDISYPLMAQDIIELMDYEQINQASVIGHSMGGKVAMQLAHSYPDRLKKLGVIDIGPWAYPPGHKELFDAVFALDIEALKSRAEADKELQSHISNLGVRQFLLKGLNRKSDGGYKWKTNFALLYQHYPQLIASLNIREISVPTLFVNGSRSNYVTKDDHQKIIDLFSTPIIEELDAGHWIHAERPMELSALINDFLM
jgi:Predicted hydrolases or acyltransferases (alpha/beta hydrolase superfamily)